MNIDQKRKILSLVLRNGIHNKFSETFHSGFEIRADRVFNDKLFMVFIYNELAEMVKKKLLDKKEITCVVSTSMYNSPIAEGIGTALMQSGNKKNISTVFFNSKKSGFNIGENSQDIRFFKKEIILPALFLDNIFDQTEIGTIKNMIALLQGKFESSVHVVGLFSWNNLKEGNLGIDELTGSLTRMINFDHKNVYPVDNCPICKAEEKEKKNKSLNALGEKNLDFKEAQTQ